MNSISAPRILEIGDHFYFKQSYPDRTTLLWSGRRLPAVLRQLGVASCTPGRLRRAIAEANSGHYDVVIAYAQLRSPWHPRYWLRAMAQSPTDPLAACARVFGTSMLRFLRLPARLAVLDMHDAFTIHRSNFFLLDKAKLYFKRELPVDRWQAIYGSAHPNLPTTRIRTDQRWRARLDKLRPISAQVGQVDPIAASFDDKQYDVFFNGAIDDNSTVRQDGLRQLQLLSSTGLRIDVPRERLSTDEYYRRMARSWMAWSPSGRGWDCHRHYEAAQCLAVPLINYPTIYRYMPLEDGVHAIYYAPEGDALARTIVHALADKERLKSIALAGREHVRRYHVGAAFCERVLRETLSDD